MRSRAPRSLWICGQLLRSSPHTHRLNNNRRIQDLRPCVPRPQNRQFQLSPAERTVDADQAPRKAVSPVRCSPTCFCTTRSTGGCNESIHASALSVMRMMRSFIAGAKGRRGRCWKPSEDGWPTAVWNCIRRRPKSSTARTTIGGAGTSESSSTFSAIPSNLGGPRIGGGATSSASCRRSVPRRRRRCAGPFASGGWHRAGTIKPLEDLARLINPAVRGWMNYYGRFYRSQCVQVLRRVNVALARWARRKYKRFKRRERASMHWLGRVARRDPKLFVLWQLGVRPEAGG